MKTGVLLSQPAERILESYFSKTEGAMDFYLALAEHEPPARLPRVLV